MTIVSSRRYAGFVRMWRVVVLLRCQPHTIDSLAQKLSVSSRTIRRDLAALQAVPLPIESRFTGPARKSIRRDEPNVWSFIDTPAWPRQEPAPIADVPSSDPARFTPTETGTPIGSA